MDKKIYIFLLRPLYRTFKSPSEVINPPEGSLSMEVPNFFFLSDLFGLPISGFATRECKNKAGNIYFFKSACKKLAWNFHLKNFFIVRSPVSGQQAGQLPPAQVHQQRGGSGQSTVVSQIKGQSHESLAALFFDLVTKSSETYPAVQFSASGEEVFLISRRQNNISNSVL